MSLHNYEPILLTWAQVSPRSSDKGIVTDVQVWEQVPAEYSDLYIACPSECQVGWMYDGGEFRAQTEQDIIELRLKRLSARYIPLLNTLKQAIISAFSEENNEVLRDNRSAYKALATEYTSAIALTLSGKASVNITLSSYELSQSYCPVCGAQLRDDETYRICGQCGYVALI